MTVMEATIDFTPRAAQKVRQLMQIEGNEALKLRVFIDYRDRDGSNTERIVRPLALSYWGRDWLLGAWCELRSAFRNFRIDRIGTLNVLSSHFTAEPGRTLDDYIRAVQD